MGIDPKAFQYQDPGVFDPTQFYQPDERSRNPRIPPNWGDILGQMLGGLGNARMAARNQEASGLLKAWEEAKTAGPEAQQQFLNNPSLPDWFKQKVLGGISPQMYAGPLQEKAQRIYTEVQNALRRIYEQAAAYEYPDARDQFIKQQISDLKATFPTWGDKLQTLPQGPDGHYRLPGVQADPMLDQVVMLPGPDGQMHPLIDPATGKPQRYRDFPKAERDKLIGDAVARRIRAAITQGFQGKPLGQVAPELVAALKGTSYEPKLSQPVPQDFFNEYGELDSTRIHNLIADAQRDRDQMSREQGTMWVNPKNLDDVSSTRDATHTMLVPASEIYAERKRAAAAAAAKPSRAYENWKREHDMLTNYLKILDTEVRNVRTTLANTTEYMHDPDGGKKRQAEDLAHLRDTLERMEKVRRRIEKLELNVPGELSGEATIHEEPVYTAEDYAGLEVIAEDAMGKGQSWESFSQKMQAANPGIDPKELRTSWDRALAAREKKRRGGPPKTRGRLDPRTSPVTPALVGQELGLPDLSNVGRGIKRVATTPEVQEDILTNP